MTISSAGRNPGNVSSVRYDRLTSSYSNNNPMKKIFPFVLCSTAAALYLSAVSAHAGYITPRVPPSASKASAQAHILTSLPTARIVTNAKHDGPGSLRQPIANAAPGD